MLGLGLVFLGLALIVLETHIVSGGLFGILAIVFILSGGKMITDAGQVLGFAVDWGLFLGISAALAIFLIIVGRLTHRALRSKDIAGNESMIGQTALVNEWSGRSGLVSIRGELWQATSDNTHNFKTNDSVVIKECDDLKLKVDPIKRHDEHVRDNRRNPTSHPEQC